MKSSRKEKLIALREFIDLETGEIKEAAFIYENQLLERTRIKNRLDHGIKKCNKCPDMNVFRYSNNAPGWGNINSPYFFLGQSLHVTGMMTGLPFISGSGYMFDAALNIIGLKRTDVFISNVVHCHPPNNRAYTENEKHNCLPYLREEIEIVQPKMVVAMGNDAQWAVSILGLTGRKDIRIIKVKHPASFSYSAPEQRVNWILKLASELEKVN